MSIRVKGRSIANVRELEISRVLGNPAVLETGLIGPIVRAFSLPRPHDPAVSLLVRYDLQPKAFNEQARTVDRETHLSFPRLAKESLIGRAEGRSWTSHAIAATDIVRVRVGTIVTRAGAATIEPLRAVRHSGRPFSDDSPEGGERLERASLVAGCGNVLVIRLVNQLTDKKDISTSS